MKIDSGKYLKVSPYRRIQNEASLFFVDLFCNRIRNLGPFQVWILPFDVLPKVLGMEMILIGTGGDDEFVRFSNPLKTMIHPHQNDGFKSKIEGHLHGTKGDRPSFTPLQGFKIGVEMMDSIALHEKSVPSIPDKAFGLFSEEFDRIEPVNSSIKLLNNITVDRTVESRFKSHGVVVQVDSVRSDRIFIGESLHRRLLEAWPISDDKASLAREHIPQVTDRQVLFIISQWTIRGAAQSIVLFLGAP